MEITPEAINDPTGINPETSQRLRADGFTSNNGIFLARSDDGGATAATTTPLTGPARIVADAGNRAREAG